MNPPQDRVAAPPLKIFINYRHSDAGWAAWALYFKLETRFGADKVFFDNSTLAGGMQWFEEIKSSLADAGAFIALIGPKWLSTLDEHLRAGGQDYVLKEIDRALRSRPTVTVIPVLVDGAELPRPSDLPPALTALPARQVERLRQEQASDDIERLIGRLVDLRGSTQENQSE
jgi:hypothetical protein